MTQEELANDFFGLTLDEQRKIFQHISVIGKIN